MPVKVGILSAAHMHVWSYLFALRDNPQSELVGLWDDDSDRRTSICKDTDAVAFDSLREILDQSDAVVITSENSRHAELALAAANAGKHILCEKPLVISEDQARQMMGAVKTNGVKLMTAFPCRFSPAFQRMKERIADGQIGAIKAICATNHGSCPFDWFVEKDKSGGGAMIDHVVHVTDLLRNLLGEDVARVQAQTGNNMYSQSWEDTAMLTLEFPSGIFATLDSSWSRPQKYKTWGDVTMKVVGEAGVIEMDMFGQAFDLYTPEGHSLAGFGSDMDASMVGAFLRAIQDDTEPPVTGWDGLQAARVALAGYESVKAGTPVHPCSDPL
jgi:predicted dehydrogenase